MKLLKLTMLLVLSAGSLAAGAETARAQGGKQPCSEDIQTFCGGTQAGGGRYRACLRQHDAEVSAACKEHLKTAAVRVAAWRQTCDADVQRLCSGVEPRGGAIVKCLRQQQAELSAACKEQLSPAQRRPRDGAPAASQ